MLKYGPISPIPSFPDSFSLDCVKLNQVHSRPFRCRPLRDPGHQLFHCLGGLHIRQTGQQLGGGLEKWHLGERLQDKNSVNPYVFLLFLWDNFEPKCIFTVLMGELWTGLCIFTILMGESWWIAMMSCLLLKLANQYVLFEMDGFGGMDWILIINHCRNGIVSFPDGWNKWWWFSQNVGSVSFKIIINVHWDGYLTIKQMEVIESQWMA